MSKEPQHEIGSRAELLSPKDFFAYRANGFSLSVRKVSEIVTIRAKNPAGNSIAWNGCFRSLVQISFPLTTMTAYDP